MLRPPTPWTSGTLVDERWLIDHVLGRGPMSIVLGAWDRVLEREVALKLCQPTADARTRLLRESRMLSKLHSPFVVRTLGAGRLSDGTPYLSMERLHGLDLHAILRSRGPLGILDTTAALLSVLDALDELHERGVVHRDVKPANVFRCVDGVYKLLDFGAAKGSDDPNITGQNAFIGTLAYLAPEQIMGRSSDARADIWAVGVLGFRLLTGTLPFEGNGSLLETAHQIVNEPPRSLATLLPEAPSPFVWALERCLSKSPANRWQTARDFAAALQASIRDLRRAG